MSEAHFDEFEHYNFDQDKNMMSGHSGMCTGQEIYIFDSDLVWRM